jgi:phage-related protein
MTFVYRKDCIDKLHQNRYIVNEEKREPILDVNFYRSDSGKEPVRDWLKSLSREDKKIIGEDIKTAQFGWPIGMPLIRSLGKGIFEVRSTLDNRISRVIFTVRYKRMILLHGFIKKDQKTPKSDLELALKRFLKLKGGDQYE